MLYIKCDALNCMLRGVRNNLALIQHSQNNQDTLPSPSPPCILRKLFTSKQKKAMDKNENEIPNHPILDANHLISLLYSYYSIICLIII